MFSFVAKKALLNFMFNSTNYLICLAFYTRRLIKNTGH